MPLRRCALLVAVVIALAWWFVPPPEEVANRHVMDGNLDRAQAVVSKENGENGPGDSISILETWRTLKTQPVTRREDARLMLVNLVLAASQSGHSDWVREMMRDGADLLTGVTDDEIRKLTAALRAGAQVELAARWLADACAGRQDPLPDDLVEMRITCLMEVNRPGEALDLLVGKLNAAPGAAPDLTLLERAARAAEFSARVDVVKPFVAKWIQASPFMQGSLEAFCSAGLPAPGRELSAFLTLGCKQAQWFEWSNQPEAAMPLYLRLARLNNAYALERIMFLYQPLRQPVEFLTSVDGLRRGHSLPQAVERERARVLGMVGRESESAEAMRHYLSTHPADAALWGDLGTLLEDMGRSREALEACQRAVAAAPDRVELQKHLADLACAAGRYEDALKVYRQMAPEAHDSTTLESYALIAESLADDAELNRALILRLQRLPTPLPADYLDLARSYQAIGEITGRLETLGRGRVAYPHERCLMRALAEGLLDAGRPAEAADLIAIEGWLDDPRQLCLYIEAGSRAEFGADALATVRSMAGFDADKLPPDTRLHYARLRLQAGDAAGAAKVLAGVAATTATFSLLAELEFELGLVKSARALQMRHLETVGSKLPESWMLLGDIERACGDEAAATAAFDRALALIRDKARAGDGAAGTTARVSPAPALRSPPRSLFQ